MSVRKFALAFALSVVCIPVLCWFPVFAMPAVQGQVPAEVARAAGEVAKALTQITPVVEFSVGDGSAKYSLDQPTHIGFLVKLGQEGPSFAVDSRLKNMVNWKIVKASFYDVYPNNPAGAVQGLAGYISTIIEASYTDPNAGDPMGMNVSYEGAATAAPANQATVVEGEQQGVDIAAPQDKQTSTGQNAAPSDQSSASLDIGTLEPPPPPGAAPQSAKSFSLWTILIVVGVALLLAAVLLFLRKRRLDAQIEDDDAQEDGIDYTEPDGEGM